ncbi:putative MFS transporter [Annulohypoxylon maeteangense]|uniref:putative MFS transporter n=1 Tax=Annulohypoxylon maeteangense TaxID=1927788 RepID=UPI0020075C69|nr:putative MFS transporter [Annulohypoxylon maeteangense]KAI0885042.1 putative MFS transporter [Annulohypoxylon maeteangense]
MASAKSLEGVKMAFTEVENQKEAIPSVLAGQGLDEEQIAQFRKFTTADPEFHSKITKTLRRKVDFRLMPMIALMFMLNFLDRNNLSQARLGTLEKDLNMTGTDFNLATSILFVGYLLMQLPSNLLLTRVRPSLYLGAAMTIWGTISAAQAASRNFSSLVVCRFFLGLAEAPFFPGAMLLMSSWYTRQELALRIAWFYCGHSFANAFGGLLGAGVLANLSGAHGIAGWRWLFIIEGSLTIGSAICSTFILPDYPSTTRWLSSEERAYAQWRLVKEVGEADAPGASTIKEGVMLALRDPRLYLFTLLQHASLLTQTFQYFFPTILQTLGYGNIETLLLTAPVWAFTFFSSLVVTYTSGRFTDRSIHIICLIMISCAGNIIAVATLNTAARFFALFLLPLGALPAYQILLAWVANSFPRPLVKRSVCISFTNMIGNTANIYGTYMYPSVDGPRYLAGGAATAGVALFVALLTLVARLELQRQNKKLALREEFEAEGNTAQPRDSEEAGAASVGFRYIL